MSQTKYELTPEHRARLPEYAERGIALALRTRPMDAEDRRICADGYREQYRLAGLPAPRVVFVPSPLVGRFAAGFAARIWHGAATWDATRDATEAATWAATRAATEAATRDATGDATWAADHWYAGLCDMAALATALGVGRPGLDCARGAWRLQRGHWPGFLAYADFFREVAELPLDWSPYDPWRAATMHGSTAWLHREFVIVSDFPTHIHRDAQHRPHCEDGPYTAWADGTRLYSWHGIRVPGWVIDHPERISLATIQGEANAEVRRVQIERYGWDRYLRESGAVPLDVWTDEGGQEVRLYDEGGIRRLRLINSTPDPDGTRREYLLRVPGPGHSEHAPHLDTAWGARNWTCRLPPGVRYGAVS